MNTKKLKWLSKKAEDKQEFYDFINSYPKEIVEYVTDVCYKNRYISFHEFIYTAGLIFNFSEYRSTREQIMLAEKALELSSGPFSSYDLDRLRKINDVVTSEYLLENCTFNEQMNLVMAMNTDSKSLFNIEMTNNRVSVRETIALSHDLNVSDKLRLMGKVSDIYDAEELEYARHMLDVEYPELEERAVKIKEFILNSIINNGTRDKKPFGNRVVIPRMITNDKLELIDELVKASSIKNFNAACDVVWANLSKDVNEIKTVLNKLMCSKTDTRFQKICAVLKDPYFIEGRSIEEKEIVLDELLKEKNEKKVNTMCSVAISGNLMESRPLEEQLKIMNESPKLYDSFSARDFRHFVLSKPVLEKRTTDEIIKLIRPLDTIDDRNKYYVIYNIISNPKVLDTRGVSEQLKLIEIASKIDDVETFEYLETTKVFTSVENISFDEQLKLIASTYKMYNKANYNKLISNYTDNDRKVKSKFRQKRN